MRHCYFVGTAIRCIKHNYQPLFDASVGIDPILDLYLVLAWFFFFSSNSLSLVGSVMVNLTLTLWKEMVNQEKSLVQDFFLYKCLYTSNFWDLSFIKTKIY